MTDIKLPKTATAKKLEYTGKMNIMMFEKGSSHKQEPSCIKKIPSGIYSHREVS